MEPLQTEAAAFLGLKAETHVYVCYYTIVNVHIQEYDGVPNWLYCVWRPSMLWYLIMLFPRSNHTYKLKCMYFLALKSAYQTQTHQQDLQLRPLVMSLTSKGQTEQQGSKGLWSLWFSY